MCLLTATKIPPRHWKIVQCRITSLKTIPVSLFEPDVEGDVGIVMEEAMVETEAGSCVNLVVENPSSEPLSLRKGLWLGSIEPLRGIAAHFTGKEKVTAVSGVDCNKHPDHATSPTHLMATLTDDSRARQLLTLLKLEEADFESSDSRKKLEQVIQENADRWTRQS